MKAALALLLALAAPSFAAGVDLDDVLRQVRRLEVGAYEVVQTPDENGQWVAELRRGETIYARHEKGGVSIMARAGTYPLLGTGEEQLVIQQYSGGSHCCWSYWVYELSGGEPRLVYDSTAYPVGYSLRAEDLDGDGVVELRQLLLTFDYFGELAHAESPAVPVVFDYSAETGRYVVASSRFPDVVLEGIDARLAELREWSGERATRYRSAALVVLLRHIYAGLEERGWEIFGGLDGLDNRQALSARSRSASTGARSIASSTLAQTDALARTRCSFGLMPRTRLKAVLNANGLP